MLPLGGRTAVGPDSGCRLGEDRGDGEMSTATDTALGTHSEVGKLRTVMVHRPDLAH